eukprot:TRINITY_DN6642_c0_g1_i1.p1 TRINITY_DN6642_c0_g1~~TRINITY_DN6642_c0_g1_i1.p1  ORF type:complete len:628 (+),score=109.42 TRINITY_DN6642_c0_g1_i1:137-2020(+)
MQIFLNLNNMRIQLEYDDAEQSQLAKIFAFFIQQAISVASKGNAEQILTEFTHYVQAKKFEMQGVDSDSETEQQQTENGAAQSPPHNDLTFLHKNPDNSAALDVPEDQQSTPINPTQDPSEDSSQNSSPRIITFTKNNIATNPNTITNNRGNNSEVVQPLQMQQQQDQIKQLQQQLEVHNQNYKQLQLQLQKLEQSQMQQQQLIQQQLQKQCMCNGSITTPDTKYPVHSQLQNGNIQVEGGVGQGQSQVNGIGVGIRTGVDEGQGQGQIQIGGRGVGVGTDAGQGQRQIGGRGGEPTPPPHLYRVRVSTDAGQGQGQVRGTGVSSSSSDHDDFSELISGVCLGSEKLVQKQLSGSAGVDGGQGQFDGRVKGVGVDEGVVDGYDDIDDDDDIIGQQQSVQQREIEYLEGQFYEQDENEKIIRCLADKETVLCALQELRDKFSPVDGSEQKILIDKFVKQLIQFLIDQNDEVCDECLKFIELSQLPDSLENLVFFEKDGVFFNSFKTQLRTQFRQSVGGYENDKLKRLAEIRAIGVSMRVFEFEELVAEILEEYLYFENGYDFFCAGLQQIAKFFKQGLEDEFKRTNLDQTVFLALNESKLDNFSSQDGFDDFKKLKDQLKTALEPEGY